MATEPKQLTLFVMKPSNQRTRRCKKLLRTHGFHSVRIQRVCAAELFSREGMIDFFQSSRLWNLVPENRKADALKMLRAQLSMRLSKGKL